MDMWRYFGRSGETARIFEIYRWPANGKGLARQHLEDVHLLSTDGAWKPNFRERLLRDLYRGWFDEDADELTEEEMKALIEKWRRDGWPGTL